MTETVLVGVWGPSPTRSVEHVVTVNEVSVVASSSASSSYTSMIIGSLMINVGNKERGCVWGVSILFIDDVY